MPRKPTYVETESQVKKIISEYYMSLVCELKDCLESDKPSISHVVADYHKDQGTRMLDDYDPDNPAWERLKAKELTEMKPEDFSRAFENLIIRQLQKANTSPDAIDDLFGKSKEDNILMLFCRHQDEGLCELAEKLKACAQLQKTLLAKAPNMPEDNSSKRKQSLTRLKEFKTQLDKPSILEKNRNEAWNQCLTAISFLLLPIAALRALGSYSTYGTVRFWVSQGKKVKTQLQEILEENVPTDTSSSPKLK